MRTRNAVAVVCGFVAAKAALTWAALNAWASYPERSPGRHWHMELGNLAEWTAGVATFSAVVAALLIAGREARSRKRESDDAAMAQARLVQIDVRRSDTSAAFQVRVNNYGDRAIIGVTVVQAGMAGHPDYSWRFYDIGHVRENVVKPDDQALSGGGIWIQILDGTGELVPSETGKTEFHEPEFAPSDPPDVVVEFMDANGIIWHIASESTIAPVRMASKP